MDADSATAKMREIGEQSNLTNVVKEMLAGDVTDSNQLVCKGKVKASLLVTGKNGKQHIIEIVEKELVHYETDEGF